MFLIFLLYAMFGSVFTAGKIGLEHAEPFFLVGSRMVAAGLLILTYLLIFNRKDLLVKTSSIRKLLMLGLFNIYLTNGFEFWGMRFLTTSKTSFIYSLSPFFAAILSYFVFRERLSKKKLLGLAIGFIGFIPILLSSQAAELSVESLPIFSYAELAVMLAAMATVYGWTLMRQLILEGCRPLVANCYSMFIGGVLSLIHSLCAESWDPVPIFGSHEVLLDSVVWMMVVSSLICYNLYGYLLKKFTVTFMSFAGFSTPFFAALFSWFAIGEVPNSSFYVSAVIVLIGLFLFYQDELNREGIRKTAS